MKLRDFGLLADENINPAVIEYLRQRQFDVLDVKERSLAGRTDSELLQFAREQNRVVLTHDRDFARLAIGMLEPMVGIVFLRPGHINAAFTIASLEVLFAREPDVACPFVIVVQRSKDEVSIRIRHLSSSSEDK
ncbi:MAG: DUF5615 family PIN-like protein [Phycisphaerae bacterium]